MQPCRSLWPIWARFLHQRGLDRIAAALFEAAGPWAVLGAQFIYIGQPFLHQAIPNGQLQDLAHLFEDEKECKEFSAFLREEGPL